jgi:hypothetical protein
MLNGVDSPKVIVTDGELSLMNTIQGISPNS